MKKKFLFALLLIISVASFSQQTTPSPAFTKQDYLEKSKNQKTTAWILLGGGLACSLAGSILSTQLEVYGYTEPLFDNNTSNAGTVLNIIGLCSMAGSIPLFIVSHKNKKKAMSLSFKNETAPQIQKSSFVYRYVPSLTLKISL